MVFSQVFLENHMQKPSRKISECHLSSREAPLKFISSLWWCSSSLWIPPSTVKIDFDHILACWVSHHFISPTQQPWGRARHCIVIHERKGEVSELLKAKQTKWKKIKTDKLSDSKAHSLYLFLGRGNHTIRHFFQKNWSGDAESMCYHFLAHNTSGDASPQFLLLI